MRDTVWDSGKWNALCDVCGFKYKNTKLMKRWDGLMVCQYDWELKHPQEMIRPIPDQAKLPWTRPENVDIFIFSCTVVTSQGVADYGTADCARADTNFGYTPTVQTTEG